MKSNRKWSVEGREKPTATTTGPRATPSAGNIVGPALGSDNFRVPRQGPLLIILVTSVM